MKNIVLGGGCFWCVEAVFERLKGVINTEVGYSGGKPNPSYESVCNGDGVGGKIKFPFGKIKLP